MSRILLFFSIVCIVFLVGCENNNKYIINLVNDEIQLYIGQTKELKYVVQKKGVNVQMDVITDIGKSKLISIDNNIIKGLDEGEVIITISLKDFPKITNSMTVKVINPLEIISDDGFEINVGHNLQLNVINNFQPFDSYTWRSENNYYARVSDGLVTAVREGVVNIIATSTTTGASIAKTIIVTDLDIESIEINEIIDNVQIGDRFTLTAKIYPQKANPNVIWSSSDESIAKINEKGEVIIMSDGKVTLTAKSSKDSQKQATVTFDVEFDPIRFLVATHVENPIRKVVTTYGYNPSTRIQTVYGSVNMYFNSNLNLVEQIIPLDNNKYAGQTATPEMLEKAEDLKLVRPGILHPETKYIVYHDTGNHSQGANAKMHAVYMTSNDNRNERARSWHYTVDEEYVYHHIPDNEVTWQGDSFEAYAMGIGIETCVNYGSDLYTTWQRTAKLMAKLLVEHSLTINDIKQHNYFSGKECPQTLRRNNLYAHALELVEAEYIVLTKLKGYTINFKSLNPEIIDDRGRVINPPLQDTKVKYTITVTNNNGYNESITLSSIIPANK